MAPPLDGYLPSHGTAAIAKHYLSHGKSVQGGTFPKDMLLMQRELLMHHAKGMDAATQFRASQTLSYLELELLCPGQGGYYHPVALADAEAQAIPA